MAQAHVHTYLYRGVKCDCSTLGQYRERHFKISTVLMNGTCLKFNYDRHTYIQNGKIKQIAKIFARKRNNCKHVVSWGARGRKDVSPFFVFG